MRENGGIDDKPAAGASTQRRYDRLSGRDRERRRARFPQTLVVISLLATVVAIAVLVGCAVLNNVVTASPATDASPATRSAPISARLGLLLAGVAAAGVFASLGKEAWGKRQTTEAWRIGAIGERATGAALDRMTAQGWIVLHDRKVPGTRENIDHIAIGPPGVAIVESKHWTGRVVVTPRRVTWNGRDADHVVGQVHRQIAAVKAALVDADHDASVTGVVCVHGARLEWRRNLGDFLSKRKAAPMGIRFCAGRHLARAITADSTLDARRVEAVARLLDARLVAA